MSRPSAVVDLSSLTGHSGGGSGGSEGGETQDSNNIEFKTIAKESFSKGDLVGESSEGLVKITKDSSLKSRDTSAIDFTVEHLIQEDVDHLDIALLDNTHAVVVYRTNNHGYVALAEFNTDTNTFVSNSNVGLQFTDEITTYYPKVVTLDSSTFVITWYESSGSDLQSIVGTVTLSSFSNTIELGTKSLVNDAISSGSSAGGHAKLAMLDSTHVVVQYTPASGGNSLDNVIKIAEVTSSTKTIDWGTEQQIATLTQASTETALCVYDSTHIVCVYRDEPVTFDPVYSKYITLDLVSKSTSSISSAVKITDTDGDRTEQSGAGYLKIEKVNSSAFLVVYRGYDYSNTWRTVARVGTLSGTTITWGKQQHIDSTSISYMPAIHVLSGDRAVIFFSGTNLESVYCEIDTSSARNIVTTPPKSYFTNQPQEPVIAPIDDIYVVLVAWDNTPNDHLRINVLKSSITIEEHFAGEIGDAGVNRLSTTNHSTPQLMHVTGNYYVIAYTNSSAHPSVRLLEIVSNAKLIIGDEHVIQSQAGGNFSADIAQVTGSLADVCVCYNVGGILYAKIVEINYSTGVFTNRGPQSQISASTSGYTDSDVTWEAGTSTNYWSFVYRSTATTKILGRLASFNGSTWTLGTETELVSTNSTSSNAAYWRGDVNYIVLTYETSNDIRQKLIDTNYSARTYDDIEPEHTLETDNSQWARSAIVRSDGSYYYGITVYEVETDTIYAKGWRVTKSNGTFTYGTRVELPDVIINDWLYDHEIAYQATDVALASFSGTSTVYQLTLNTSTYDVTSVIVNNNTATDMYQTFILRANDNDTALVAYRYSNTWLEIGILRKMASKHVLDEKASKILPYDFLNTNFTQFLPSNTSQITDLASTNLDGTNSVTAYTEGTMGAAVVSSLDIDAETVTPGLPITFVASGISDIAVTVLDSTHIAIAYRDENDQDHGECVIGTVTPNTKTITFGTPVAFNGTNATEDIDILKIDPIHVAISFKTTDAAGGKCVIGEINTASNTVSFGTIKEYDASTTNYGKMCLFDNTHLVIGYRDEGSANNGTFVVGTIDTGIDDVTFGSPQVFNNQVTTYLDLVTINETQLLCAYYDATDVDYYVNLFDVDTSYSITEVSGAKLQINNDNYSTLGSNRISLLKSKENSFFVSYINDGFTIADSRASNTHTNSIVVPGVIYDKGTVNKIQLYAEDHLIKDSVIHNIVDVSSLKASSTVFPNDTFVSITNIDPKGEILFHKLFKNFVPDREYDNVNNLSATLGAFSNDLTVKAGASNYDAVHMADNVVVVVYNDGGDTKCTAFKVNDNDTISLGTEITVTTDSLSNLAIVKLSDTSFIIVGRLDTTTDECFSFFGNVNLVSYSVSTQSTGFSIVTKNYSLEEGKGVRISATTAIFIMGLDIFVVEADLKTASIRSANVFTAFSTGSWIKSLSYNPDTAILLLGEAFSSEIRAIKLNRSANAVEQFGPIFDLDIFDEHKNFHEPHFEFIGNNKFVMTAHDSTVGVRSFFFKVNADLDILLEHYKDVLPVVAPYTSTALNKLAKINDRTFIVAGIFNNSGVYDFVYKLIDISFPTISILKESSVSSFLSQSDDDTRIVVADDKVVVNHNSLYARATSLTITGTEINSTTNDTFYDFAGVVNKDTKKGEELAVTVDGLVNFTDRFIGYNVNDHKFFRFENGDLFFTDNFDDYRCKFITNNSVLIKK